jgi:hypothetical protein
LRVGLTDAAAHRFETRVFLFQLSNCLLLDSVLLHRFRSWSPLHRIVSLIFRTAPPKDIVSPEDFKIRKPVPLS